MGDPGWLLRFRAKEWASDEPEVPPAYWPPGFPKWRTITAYQRYSAAVRAWRREHGVTFDEWQQMKRRGGAG